MNNSKTPKVKIMARLFLDTLSINRHISEFAEIGVCFSFIIQGEERPDGTPHFASDYYLKGNQKAIGDIKLVGQMSKSYTNMLNFELKSMDSNMTFAKAEAFVKACRFIVRKVSGCNDDDHAAYVAAVVKALGCDSIMFESFSEESGLNRWNEYSLNDIPVLLKKASDMMIKTKGW